MARLTKADAAGQLGTLILDSRVVECEDGIY
jgi:hypothetical protein